MAEKNEIPVAAASRRRPLRRLIVSLALAATPIGFVTSLVLIALVATSFSACGGGGSTSTQGTESYTTNAEAIEATADPTLDPKNLVARLSDLPAGYSLDPEDSGPETLEQALEGATPEEAALIRRERVAGHTVTFKSPVSLTQVGSSISCTATVYRTTDGATRLFRFAVDGFGGSELEKELLKVEGGTLTPARLGETVVDEAAAFTETPFGVSLPTVLWRDNNVASVCSIFAIDVSPALEEVVRVARAQQARIARALG